MTTTRLVVLTGPEVWQYRRRYGLVVARGMIDGVEGSMDAGGVDVMADSVEGSMDGSGVGVMR